MRTNSLNDEGETLLKFLYRSSLILILTVMLFFLPASHAALADGRPEGPEVVDLQEVCEPWNDITFKVKRKRGISYQVKGVRIEGSAEKGILIDDGNRPLDDFCDALSETHTFTILGSDLRPNCSYKIVLLYWETDYPDDKYTESFPFVTEGGTFGSLPVLIPNSGSIQEIENGMEIKIAVPEGLTEKGNCSVSVKSADGEEAEEPVYESDLTIEEETTVCSFHVASNLLQAGTVYRVTVMHHKNYYDPWRDSFLIAMIDPAKVLRLPQDLTEIETEAFFGVDAQMVEIPDGVEEVGNLAFAESPVIAVTYPEGTHFEDDAFNNCGTVVMLCRSSES